MNRGRKRALNSHGSATHGHRAPVNASGSVVWRCMPRFNGTPVFDEQLKRTDDLLPDAAMTVE